MNKLIILSIILFIILEIISKKMKEPLIINYTDEMIINNLDDVIKYLNNCIQSRENASSEKNVFYGDKYQKQILPFKNAVSYSNYIKKLLIKK